MSEAGSDESSSGQVSSPVACRRSSSGAAVDKAEGIVFGQGLLDDVFVFFFFQRTSGVDEASSGSDVGQGRAEDCELALPQFCQIIDGEAPFDFGISGQRTGAGAGDVGEDAVEEQR